MLQVNNEAVQHVKFGAEDVDKVIWNGDVVFEKTLAADDNTIAMRTLAPQLRLKIITTDASPCNVLQDGVVIATLMSTIEKTFSIDPSKKVVLNSGLITTLHCYDNQLTTLDVSKNTALINLFCYANQLTALDVSKNTKLINLYCDNNQLTAASFKQLFLDLPTRTSSNGSAVLYRDGDNSHKDFTQPQDLADAFAAAKAKNWKFYKNNTDPANEI